MSRKKGDRHETEAVNILGRVFGSGGVEKVDAYSNHDPFGFVDIIAIESERKVLFVQVKTNRLSAEVRRKYLRRMRRLPTEHATFEVWVRVDDVGWKMARYDPEEDELNWYLELDTCDTETTVEAVREEFGFYD